MCNYVTLSIENCQIVLSGSDLIIFNINVICHLGIEGGKA